VKGDGAAWDKVMAENKDMSCLIGASTSWCERDRTYGSISESIMAGSGERSEIILTRRICL